MTADPDAYVPREAMERARTELARCVLEEASPIALTGPAGLGKTLLLRLLARQMAGRVQCVYLPYPALPAEDLCRWTLHELGETPEGDPGDQLVATALRRAASATPVLLMIDDAALLPPESAARLAVLCEASEGALRVLVTAADGPERTREVLQALGPRVRVVRLDQAMNASETSLYLRERLTGARASPATRDRFDEITAAGLFRESGGVPRRLHQLASEMLLGLVDLEHEPPEPKPSARLSAQLPEPEPTPPPEGPVALPTPARSLIREAEEEADAELAMARSRALADAGEVEPPAGAEPPAETDPLELDAEPDLLDVGDLEGPEGWQDSSTRGARPRHRERPPPAPFPAYRGLALVLLLLAALAFGVPLAASLLASDPAATVLGIP